jgi:hypothetical protein
MSNPFKRDGNIRGGGGSQDTPAGRSLYRRVFIHKKKSMLEAQEKKYSRPKCVRLKAKDLLHPGTCVHRQAPMLSLT